MPRWPGTPLFAAAALLLIALSARAQTSEVTATIDIVDPAHHAAATGPANSEAVLWLTPLGAKPLLQEKQYRIVQKNKSFDPRLLVVPVGSSVEFPNQDPFFHNVFSLFDGKRFDLGLYEAGSKRSVQFNHEGVSYLFCNIHPEMSAVVIALSTPYFASVSNGGRIVLHDVPAGSYELNIWSHHADPAELKSLTRKVQIAAGATSLGTLTIHCVANPAAHKNKFGEDYPAETAPRY